MSALRREVGMKLFPRHQGSPGDHERQPRHTARIEALAEKRYRQYRGQREDGVAHSAAGTVAHAKAHENNMATLVRMAMARFEFTSVTPTFASNAVKAAKPAEPSAQ